MPPTRHTAWLFVAPAVALLVLVAVVPLLAITNYAFFDIFTLESRFWIGPEWFQALVTTPDLYQALGRSLLFSALVLCVQIPLGISIALLLPRAGWTRNVMLLVLAVPLVVPWNMIPPIWLGLLNPDFGMLARVLAALGVTLDYKFNALHTWFVLLLMDSWHWTGLVAILCYSGLSSISPAYYQAAAIDSASRWQVFRFVQLPAMRGVLMMALLLRLMDSLMIYTEAFGINAGGPQGATTFLSLALGEEIAAFNYGPAAARSVLYFGIVLTIAYAFRAVQQRQAGAAQ